MGAARPSSAAQLAAIKGGNTTDIMIQLYRNNHDVPAKIPDTNINLRQLVHSEALTAQMRIDATAYPSHLAYSTGIIQTGLTHLEKAGMERGDPQTIRLHQDYVRQFTELREEAKERIVQRNKLTQLIHEFVKEVEIEHKEILKAIVDRHSSKEIEERLNAIVKKQNTLVKQMENLNINEDALQHKLNRLHTAAVHSAEAIVGINLEKPRPIGKRFTS